jgi:mono/diheme cytochrome c family protein
MQHPPKPTTSERTVTAQHTRENPEPHEASHPIPWVLLVLVAVLTVFGVLYIGHAAIDSPSTWGDGRASEELQPTRSSAGKVEKVDGAALYAAQCVACHQATGQGLPGVFPPLAGSEWVLGKDSTAAAILLHGINGPMSVKGVTYNGAMPAFKDTLSDAQIAAVLTHVRSQWGNAAAPVTPETVASTRAEHTARTTAFAGDKELPPHH